MSFKRQLMVLVGKNFIIMKREWKSTLVSLLFIIFFAWISSLILNN